MKTARITRIVQLLTTLQSENRYSVADLCKIFGTSRRTIFRDLNELKAIGIPCRYDGKSGGYRMDPEFFLPPMDLNLREALSLLLLVHEARNQVQVPFRKAALLAGLKIENNLPARIRQYCISAMQNISARAHAQAPAAMLDEKFAQFQRAIKRRRRVSICYNSLFDGAVIEVELSPYHLMYNRRAWYVIGFSALHKSIRTFKLNRIRRLKVLDRGFTGGEGFDLNEYLGKAWAMIPEGRLYNVKLRFLPKVAENAAEVQWHSTQRVRRNDDGSVTMEFRVDGLEEISWWILGYGDQVEVIRPKALRLKILTKAEKMVELNKRV